MTKKTPEGPGDPEPIPPHWKEGGEAAYWAKPSGDPEAQGCSLCNKPKYRLRVVYEDETQVSVYICKDCD